MTEHKTEFSPIPDQNPDDKSGDLLRLSQRSRLIGLTKLLVGGGLMAAGLVIGGSHIQNIFAIENSGFVTLAVVCIALGACTWLSIGPDQM